MRPLILLLVLALAGCSDDAPSDFDAGTRPIDASQGVDASTPTQSDAGSSDGAVPTPDSGVGGEDAGVPTGTPLWIGVGGWGFRASTRDGRSYHVESNPSTGNDHSPDLLRGIGFGNGTFIAVGGDANSMVMRTRDGITWEEDLHPAGSQWKGDVAFGGGRWVAVGGVGSVILSDDDGLSWRAGPENLAQAGRSIAYGGGTFVAVGDNALIATSSNGESWTRHGPDSGLRYTIVGYGRGMWFVGGSEWNGGGFTSDCALSEDGGSSWSSCPFTVGRFGAASTVPEGLLVTRDGGYLLWNGSEWLDRDADVPENVYEGDGTWVGVSSERRFVGSSLDSMEAIDNSERGFRDFVGGFTP